MTDSAGRVPLPPLSIPENWNDLTDEQKRELVTEALTGWGRQLGLVDEDPEERP